MELPKLPEGYYWKVKTVADPMFGLFTRVSLKRNWHGLRYTTDSRAIYHLHLPEDRTPEVLKECIQERAEDLYAVWERSTNKVFEREFAEYKKAVDGIY